MHVCNVLTHALCYLMGSPCLRSCDRTLVFRTPRDELYDVVTLVQLICHVSKVVTKFNFHLLWSPSVYFHLLPFGGVSITVISTVNVVSGCNDSLELSLLANAFRSASNRSVQCKFSGLVYMGVIIRFNIKNTWWCSCTLFSTRCVRMDLVMIGFHAQTGKLNLCRRHNNNWGK